MEENQKLMAMGRLAKEGLGKFKGELKEVKGDLRREIMEIYGEFVGILKVVVG